MMSMCGTFAGLLHLSVSRSRSSWTARRTESIPLNAVPRADDKMSKSDVC